MSDEFDFVESEIRVGLSVIEASAGTGKTYAISHLVPRLLLDGTATHLGEIVLVTFTNDAARELSDRVRRVLEKLHAVPTEDEAAAEPGVYRLRRKFDESRIASVIGRALLDLDRLQVSTIHAFCQRTLQTEGTLCGLPVMPELIPDANAIVEDALYDIWEQRIAADPLASGVATAMTWKLSDDLKFVRTALPLEGAIPVPQAESFSANLRRLDSYAARFTDTICSDLELLLREVQSWKKDAEVIEPAAVAAALRSANSAADAGFLSAARSVAGAADGINSRKRSDKELKGRVADCEAARLASEVEDLLARLQWDFRNESLAEVRVRVADKLRSNRQITYDGLIDTLAAALMSNHGRPLANRLRSRHKVALIDESQDTDARQFEIFRNVFVGFEKEEPLAGHRLVLIGDPKQAIYAFRGADVNTYLAAREEAGRNIFHLTKTYRAPGPLVHAINTVFNHESSLLKDGLPFLDGSSGINGDVRLAAHGETGSSRIEAWCVPDSGGDDYSNSAMRRAHIADTVASEIVRILNAQTRLVETSAEPKATERNVVPGDIAVLVNSHREAEAMSDALLARAVPAIRAGNDDVMATDEAAELLTLLRAIHEPRRRGLRLAALGTRLLGRTAENLRSMREGGEEESQLLQRFLEWQECWHRNGIASALARVDRDESMTARLAPMGHGERRVTNIRQVTDLLQAASIDLAYRPDHLVRWLAQEISRVSGSRSAEDRQLQLDSDADAVQIVTMHSAKGLEYALVFCPFLWSLTKPSGVEKLAIPGDATRLVEMGLNSDDGIEASVNRAALEDRLRLAYVAVTRAKVKAWILSGEVCGSRNRPPASALDWLLRSEGDTYDRGWIEKASGPGRGTRHEARLKQLCAKSGGTIALREPPAPADLKWRGSSKTGASLLAALPAPSIPEAWRMTSFSALTREKNPHGGESPAVTVMVEKASTGGDTFLSMPGGALLGTAVHEWIERWDFSEPAFADVSNHLARYPLKQGNDLAKPVRTMLNDLRSVRLSGFECTVGDACPEPQSSEWHFQLPISEALSSGRLAEVFASRGHADYAALLASLPVEQLAGYLHGFLDRVAFHDGAWGVIDWKTNNLGPSVENYAQDSLAACARSSHYLLQAHLYLVALRRYLGSGARIAGAWLAFLRGIRAGTSDGILHIQPSADLMEALDALFTKATAHAMP